MPYLKRPPLKDPSGVVLQAGGQVCVSQQWDSPAVAITVIHSSLGIYFENVSSTKKGLQSKCLTLI